LSLARQMVRYLRNTLMAKLDGEKTELLQISGDERARAARTALLFTEEDITRNLQIVLRTFDDLNYRQEQRFHLELGLLKLIHAQRLLPLEELLSGVTGGSTIRSGTPASPRSSSPAQRTAAAPVATAAATSPSPFGSSGSGWSAGPTVRQGVAAGSVAEMERSVSISGLATPGLATRAEAFVNPLPRAPEAAIPFPAAPAFAGVLVEETPAGGAAGAPEITAAPTVETLRLAVISALADGGHASAAQLLGAGSWTLDGSGLRIEVAGMSKKMLSLTVNTAAEKIMRQEMQRLGAPSRFLIVPGEGSGGAATAVAVSLAGSIQESALANPLVQRAKEIFKAEVRSVVDLRIK